MDDYEEVIAEHSTAEHSIVRTGLGLERVSIASAVSTESGIHMGSDHDGTNTRGPGTPELLVQKRLASIMKKVRRSHSYNVSDLNKNTVQRKTTVRPKSLVHGWEESTVSVEELYLWQTQLRQLQVLSKVKENPYTTKTKPTGMTKVPKKDSLRAKAKTLIRGLKAKEKRKNKGSLSSSCTEDDPDSTSSSVEKTPRTVKTKLKDLHNTSWNTSQTSPQEQWNSSDLLTILKVFAGDGLQRSQNAEYRSVLATIDTTVLEIKKQSISKYGLEDCSPDHYQLVCSVGSYLDDKGNTLNTTNEDFGSKSDIWKEFHVDYLNDDFRPLSRRAIFEEMDTTRLELRNRTLSKQEDSPTDEKIRRASGLHHYPAEGPFLLLIQGYDRELDHVIYPLTEGETLFLSLGTLPAPRYAGNIIILHVTQPVQTTVRRTGRTCTLCVGSKEEQVMKCGQAFNVGPHYKFIFREAMDNAILTPEVGSPDTQRTLSTGTLTSLSPDINNVRNVTAGVHQHAEPRFIFYIDQTHELLEGIICYETLSHKNPLACAHLTIMCLRHAFDNFSPEQIDSVMGCCKQRIEALAKVVQQKAIVILNERSSATSFLKPMMKLLANTLEILHFAKENKPSEIVRDLEKDVVPMFEHIAFHTAKMVYELLPSLLGVEETRDTVTPSRDTVTPVHDTVTPVRDTVTPSSRNSPPSNPTTPVTPTSSTALTVDRRWSVPTSPRPAPPTKRKMNKRPRQASLCTVREERRQPQLGDGTCCRGDGTCCRGDTTCCHGDATKKEKDSLTRSVDDLISNLNSTNLSPRICRRTSKGGNKPDLTNIGQGVRNLVHLLQKFYSLGTSCKLNNSMTKQLFTSIFFFSNTTLFNTIVESPEVYFTWNKGIQLRINLDYILKWAHQAQLSYVSNLYFRELNQLLDLLSLPKKDLLSSTWSALSKTFPDLSAAQLHHVLIHYHVAETPRIWDPPSTAVVLSDIRIQLTAYPPLVIPSRGYRLSTCYEIPDSLRSALARLTRQISGMVPEERISSRGSSSSATPGPSPSEDGVFTATRTISCTLEPNSKSIGLKLKKNSRGCIIVSEVVPNSPAHLAGDVERLDELVEINKIQVARTSVPNCKRIIDNSQGSITIVVQRTS